MDSAKEALLGHGLTEATLAGLKSARLVPLITPVDVQTTVAMAKALARGGIRVIEIALRSEPALDSIVAVKQAVPELLVAAGTVTNPGELRSAYKAGAELAFSPGWSDALLDAAAQQQLALVPGVSTASDVMACASRGFSVLKLFPAEAVGGRALLRALAGPFPQAAFCPTGGINSKNLGAYLALDNVLCCGGTWLVSDAALVDGDWDTLTEVAASLMCEEDNQTLVEET
ncbi:MAG: bifunctional 4-hydroxy-2-oxoglutarate aldolase/2-dehydro-3-deoxy-phosphogluconate aldolase [Pseudomonadota bacterium]